MRSAVPANELEEGPGDGSYTTAPATIPYAATINTDVSSSTKFDILLTGNATLAAPTGAAPGRVCYWAIQQDGVGGRTLALPGVFDFGAAGAPVFTTTANAVNLIWGYYHTASAKWLVTFRKA